MKRLGNGFPQPVAESTPRTSAGPTGVNSLKSAPKEAPARRSPPVARVGDEFDGQKVHQVSVGLGPASPAVAVSLSLPTALPLSRLTKVPAGGLLGVSYCVDSTTLVGLHLNARKFEDPSRGPGLELNFRLTPQAARSAEKRLADAGAVRSESKFAYSGWTVREDQVLVPDSAMQVTLEGATVQRVSNERFDLELGSDENGLQTMRHLGRVRLYGSSDAELRASLLEAVGLAGLEAIVEPSTEPSRRLLCKLQLLDQANPKAAEKLARGQGSPDFEQKVDRALQAEGRSPEQLQRLQIDEVVPGYHAVVDPTQGGRYADLGVRYLFCGVKTAKSVVDILASGALLSSRARLSSGLFVRGAHFGHDFVTGGADSAFLRIVTEAARGKRIQDCDHAGQYQLRFGTELLDRTDWHAYYGGRAGSTLSPEDAEKIKRSSAVGLKALSENGPAPHQLRRPSLRGGLGERDQWQGSGSRAEGRPALGAQPAARRLADRLAEEQRGDVPERRLDPGGHRRLLPDRTGQGDADRAAAGGRNQRTRGSVPGGGDRSPHSVLLMEAPSHRE